MYTANYVIREKLLNGRWDDKTIKCTVVGYHSAEAAKNEFKATVIKTLCTKDISYAKVLAELTIKKDGKYVDGMSSQFIFRHNNLYEMI